MFRWLAWAATRSFYRLRVLGLRPPRRGPVLLLANHPNALLDPAMVLGSAGRQVRFLAKSTLFDDARVAVLMRAAGAIPVYRRSDDPAAMGGNESMFRAVDDALVAGSAIGLFPEGRSHSEPSIGELRTGAARIALSAAARLGGAFDIVPVGLVFRAKETFRSQAAVVFGEPVEWGDLALRGVDDRDAVRELTERLDEALRRVTVNLEDWEDRPLIEGAVEIWGTERDGDSGDLPEDERLRRLHIAADLLRETRRSGPAAHRDLVIRLRRHLERLDRLSLTPRSLWSRTKARVAASWAGRRLYLLGLPMLVAAAAGWLIFRIPNELTGRIAERTSPNVTEMASRKLLLGMLLNALWLVVWAVVVASVGGLLTAAAVIAALPIVGATGSWVRVRWKGALVDARRFLFLRSRRELVASLREDQSRLAEELEELVAPRLGEEPSPLS